MSEDIPHLSPYSHLRLSIHPSLPLNKTYCSPYLCISPFDSNYLYPSTHPSKYDATVTSSSWTPSQGASILYPQLLCSKQYSEFPCAKNRSRTFSLMPGHLFFRPICSFFESLSLSLPLYIYIYINRVKLSSRPTPSLENQGMLFRLGLHFRSVRQGIPYQKLRCCQHCSQGPLTTQASPLRNSKHTNVGGNDFHESDLLLWSW